MPFIPQLGMSVDDPLAAYASGQPAAAAFERAYENEPERQRQLQQLQQTAQENALRMQGRALYQKRFQELMQQPGTSPAQAAAAAFVEYAPYFDPRGAHTAVGQIYNADVREA